MVEPSWFETWGHVVEARNLPIALRGDKLHRYIESLGPQFAKSVDIRWYDDENAFVCFPNSTVAREALSRRELLAPPAPAVFSGLSRQMKQLYDKSGATEPLPTALRPETDARVARRLISHALASGRSAEKPKATPATTQGAYLKQVDDSSSAIPHGDASSKGSMSDSWYAARSKADAESSWRTRAGPSETASASSAVAKHDDSSSALDTLTKEMSKAAVSTGTEVAKLKVRGRGGGASSSGVFKRDDADEIW